MLTGIVIDALDVRRMSRFWLEATRGRTDGLEVRCVAASEPRAAQRTGFTSTSRVGCTGRPR